MEATKKRPKIVLVTGLPGSGKSYLHEYLKCIGVNSVDADDHCLSYNGKKLQRGASISWLVRNYPRWDTQRFVAMLDEGRGRDLYVVGVVPNMLRFLHYFDEAYYLDASKDVLRKRLQIPRENMYGTTSAQRKIAVSMKPVAVIASRIVGFRFIDATLKPEEIFARISQNSVLPAALETAAEGK